MLNEKIRQEVHDIIYMRTVGNEQEQEKAVLGLIESSLIEEACGRSVRIMAGGERVFNDVVPGNPELEPSYAVYDTETTGLDTSTARIVELAAKVVRGADSQVRSWFVSQDGPLPEVTVNLTGITDEMVEKDGVPPVVALREFSEFVGDLRIVGHNALRYDNPLILNEFRRAGLRPPSGIGREDQFDTAAHFKNRRVNLLRMDGETDLDYQVRVLNVRAYGKFNLGFACAEMGIGVFGAHRAKGDVEMTDRLFRALSGWAWEDFSKGGIPATEVQHMAKLEKTCAQGGLRHHDGCPHDATRPCPANCESGPPESHIHVEFPPLKLDKEMFKPGGFIMSSGATVETEHGWCGYHGSGGGGSLAREQCCACNRTWECDAPCKDDLVDKGICEGRDPKTNEKIDP